MSANAERRLAGDLDLVLFHTPAANNAATVAFPAVADVKNSVAMLCLSKSGTTPAVASATLVYTKNGVATTLTFLIPAAQLGPQYINFGTHPLEGDTNTAMTLTLPAMGATESGSVWMAGYKVPA